MPHTEPQRTQRQQRRDIWGKHKDFKAQKQIKYIQQIQYRHPEQRQAEFVSGLIQDFFVNAICKNINEYKNCSFQANHLRIAMLAEVSHPSQSYGRHGPCGTPPADGVGGFQDIKQRYIIIYHEL